MCRLIGGVGLYACHDQVIGIDGGKEEFIGTTPGNVVIFYLDKGWDLCRPASFPGSGNIYVGHNGLPLGEDFSSLYCGVSVGMCASFGHDSPVTR